MPDYTMKLFQFARDDLVFYMFIIQVCVNIFVHSKQNKTLVNKICAINKNLMDGLQQEISTLNARVELIADLLKNYFERISK
jgi:cbb3-type cytochrome oxidase subunit 3